MSDSIDIGAVLRRTAHTYARESRTLLSASAAVVLFMALLELPAVTRSPVIALAAAILQLVAIALFAAFVIALATPLGEDGRRSKLGDAVNTAKRAAGEVGLVLLVAGIAIALLAVFLQFAFVAVLAAALLGGGKPWGGLLAGIGVGLILTTVPTLVLVTVWSLALPIAVVERPGGVRALGQSRAMVRGNRLRVFAVLAVVAICAVVLEALLRALFGTGEYAGASVSAVLTGLLLAPLPLLAIASLYGELRGRRPDILAGEAVRPEG